MAAYGLYTHIAANKTRSVLLLGGLFLLVYVLVYAGALVAEVLIDSGRRFDDYLFRAWRDLIAAFPFATIAAAMWIAIAYLLNTSIVDAVTGARAVTRAEAPRLYNLLENLCISRGIPMPKLKIAETEALNAYASGLNRRQYAITVTRGLLNALDDREIEAVLGHELTHIRNGDVQMMVIAVIIAGVIGFFAELVFRLLFQGDWRFGGWSSGSSSSSSSSSSGSSDRKSGSGGGAVLAILAAIALIALAWLLSQVVKLALSRSREFLADAGSVELTKDPDAMISALRKIENRGELEGATSAVMELCLDNPRSGFSDLFATHPSIAARVDALVRYAGGRDPGPLALPAPEEELADAADGEAGEQRPALAPQPSGAPHPWGEAAASPWTEPPTPPPASPERPSPWGALPWRKPGGFGKRAP